MSILNKTLALYNLSNKLFYLGIRDIYLVVILLTVLLSMYMRHYLFFGDKIVDIVQGAKD